MAVGGGQSRIAAPFHKTKKMWLSSQTALWTTIRRVTKSAERLLRWSVSYPFGPLWCTPPLCKSTGKSTELTGNNTYCCSRTP